MSEKSELNREFKKQVAELRNERDFYKCIVEATPTFMVIIDAEGQVRMMNDAMLQALGYSLDEVIGKDYIHTFVPPSDQKSLASLFQRLVEWDKATVNENHITTRDGRNLLVEWHGIPVFKPDGRFDFFYGLGIDISSRRAAEEALRESEERFRCIADFSPLPLAIVDGKGNYEYLNPKFLQTFGYNLTDIPMGKRWFELAFPDLHYRRSVVTTWKHDVANLDSKLATPRTFKLTCKNGTVKDVLFRPVVMDNGKYLIIYEDITQRLRTETDLNYQKSFFETLFANSLDAIAFVDEKHNIVLINDRFTTLFGYTREECVGKRLDIILATEETMEESGKISAKVLKGIPHTGNTLRHGKDGKGVHVNIKAIPFMFEGRYTGGFGIYADITARKQAEQIIADYTGELEQLYRQLDKEMDKARHIHERNLPNAFPQIEGISLAVLHRPAQRLGGDYYNFIQAGNKLIIYLSDVMGHGLDGAMLNVFVKATINSYISLKPEDIHPDKLLYHLDTQYRNQNYPEEYLICVFLAILDLETYKLSYTGAGFQTPVLVHLGDDRIEENDGSSNRLKLISKALPIMSVIPPELMDFQTEQICISPGTTLLFSTDGLPEQTVNGTLYYDRLAEVFYANTHLTPHLIAQAISEDFRQFNNGSLQGNDDITFLLLQIEAQPKAELHIELKSCVDQLIKLQRQALPRNCSVTPFLTMTKATVLF